MKLVVRYFLRGVVVVVPAAVTIWILWQVFVAIDRIVPLPYPGAGLAITLVGTILVGILASNIVTRRLFEWTERFFERAPVARIIYRSIKDLIEAFVGDQKRFNKPVVVDLVESGDVRAIGFVTCEDLAHLGMPGSTGVYFPQAYNVAGNLIIVPSTRVRALDTDPARTMAFVVSGGVAGELT